MTLHYREPQGFDFSEVDLSSLPTVTPEQALQMIQEAHRNGTVEFTFPRPAKFFALETPQGEFVAQITHLGGDARVSNPPDARDYSDLWIDYRLHARIERE